MKINYKYMVLFRYLLINTSATRPGFIPLPFPPLRNTSAHDFKIRPHPWLQLRKKYSNILTFLVDVMMQLWPQIVRGGLSSLIWKYTQIILCFTSVFVSQKKTGISTGYGIIFELNSNRTTRRAKQPHPYLTLRGIEYVVLDVIMKGTFLFISKRTCDWFRPGPAMQHQLHFGQVLERTCVRTGMRSSPEKWCKKLPGKLFKNSFLKKNSIFRKQYRFKSKNTISYKCKNCIIMEKSIA